MPETTETHFGPSPGNGGSKLYTGDKTSSPQSGHKASPDQRAAVAAYIGAELHFLPERQPDGTRVKSIPKIARELGTTPGTARRWLRRDHFETWLEHWPTAVALWSLAQQERGDAPPRSRVALALPDLDPDEIAREEAELN